ncbi:MAG: hypothetical protein AAGC73_01280 [Verrucomicrobiota bacterium]
MCYPRLSLPIRQLLCVGAALLFGLSLCEARIGDSQSNLERRLLGNGGLKYKDDVIIDARREKMPYEEFLLYMESDVKLEIYHKSATENKAQRSKFNPKRMLPGWDLHVIYINGKSAVEVYQRSPVMTEQEMNYLLLLQGEGSGWSKRVKDGLEKPAPGQLESADEESVTAFGFGMVRNDGAVRAKKIKNGLLFVDAKWDVRFAVEKDKEHNAGAPISVNGF